MSHFTCLVIGSDPEELLAPFQENNNGDCPQEYMEFEDREDEFKDEWKNGTHKGIKVGNKYYLPTDERFRVKGSKGCYSSDSFAVPEGLKEEEVPFKKLYKNFKQFVKEWHTHASPDPETGKYGYWFNPNAKWDWFQVGGRWAGFFKLKKGKEGMLGEKSWANENEEIPEGRADQAKKGDIDFEGMLADNFEKYSKLYDKFEVAMKDDPDKAKKSAYWEYGIASTSEDKEKFIPQTREQYLKAHCFPSTFAVLKDGEWYQKGSMGWWAIVSNEKEEAKWDKEFLDLLEGLPENTILSVCDCHI